jgi:copper chaperone CopZ
MPAAANLQVVNFSVPGMHCEFSCAPKVREVLTQQPGVAEVEVDLASKTAWVKADPDQFDAEAAVAALLDVQFDDTQVITATQAQEARDAAATVTTPEDAS